MDEDDPIILPDGLDAMIGQVVPHAYFPIDVKIIGHGIRGGYEGIVVAIHNYDEVSRAMHIGKSGRFDSLLDARFSQEWAINVMSRFTILQ